MIILAVGMPRAGSGWHYNLTHDLMRTAGAADAREIRSRYRLQSILTEVNCNIGALTWRRVAMAMIPSLRGETFTLKLHAGPTAPAAWLIGRGHIRPTYIYRDPRDAALSAYEYGRRAVAKGRPNAFSHLDTIEKALTFITEYVHYWHAWLDVPGCHTLQYEQFKASYTTEASRLADFLGIDPAEPAAAAAIERYRPDQASRGDRGLHFHKGLSGRFREVFTLTQQQFALDAFGGSLEKMGYAP
jgi:hypothetical protein